MIKYLITKKIKSEVEKKSKKIMIYTGVVAAGVGTYATYKVVKKYLNKKVDDEEILYLEQIYDNQEKEKEKKEKAEEEELEKKVEEFNSRRLNSKNENDKDDMTDYVENMEYDKDNIEIDEKDYVGEKYDDYEEK